MGCRRCVLALGILVGSAAQIAAHPHMFLDTGLAIRMGQDGVVGIGITWYFDPMFTAQIKMDFDANRDGAFNAAETASVYENAFSNLRNYDYFTYVSWGGQVHAATEVQEFRVALEQGRLVYRFVVPFAIPLSRGEDRLVFSVAVYDKTFFCDVAYTQDEPVTLERADGWTLSSRIERSEGIEIKYDNSVVGATRQGATYTGVVHPLEVTVVIERR